MTTVTKIDDGRDIKSNRLYVPFKDYQARCAKLEAENKRLREALEIIAKLDSEWRANKLGGVRWQRQRWMYMGEKARLALDMESAA